MGTCKGCGGQTPPPNKHYCNMSCRIIANRRIDFETGCWLWTANKKSGGYGRIVMKNRAKNISLLAHRAAYMAFTGPIPRGLHVLHRCHTPSCVNPAHLRLGTHLDNMRDAVERGTHPTIKKRKLTPTDVRAIRNDHRPPRFLAKEYGIKMEHVCRIRSRRAWKQI